MNYTQTSASYPHQGLFFWFQGVVEDIMDPKKLGRVRVRAFGFHSDNKKELLTTDLPWATPLTPITSASFKGIGTSATGLKVGSWVFGFFRDGAAAQEPVIMGSIQTSTDNVEDIPLAAKTNYPYRSVIHTESGHEVIVDDKSGSETISITHKTGSYILMDKDGNVKINAPAKVDIISGGDMTLNSGANMQLTANNITLTSRTGGFINLN